MNKIVILALLLVISGGMTNPAMVSTTFPNNSDPVEGRSLPAFMRLSPQWALEQLENLTLEEKIAQSFMVEVTPRKGEDHLKIIDSLVKVHHVGGVIMFQGNVQQTKDVITRLQSESKIPLMVGMDAEWGSDMRLSDGERFPFQLTMGAANQLESTRIISQAMGQEMRELGIHISFSPVVDINSNPQNPVINFRAFGENPLSVAKHSVEMVKGIQDFNVLASMKHFPGHGDTDMDSHLDLPTIHKSKQELSRMDWLPYRQGRLAGASSVMVGHLNVPSLDNSGTPASLSSIIIKDILKKELKFDGLIISDALNMKALTKRYGDVDIVVKAYQAGNDILLYPSKVKESIQAIKSAVEKGEISVEEVEEKALKILRAKYWSLMPEKDVKSPELNQEVVEFAKINIYEKALTVLKNENVIPVQDASGKNLILNIGADGTGFNQSASNYVIAETAQFKTANEALAAYQTKFKDYDHVFVNLIAPSVLPRNDYSYPAGWRTLLERLPKEAKVYLTFFGNPYAVKDRYMFENADAVVLTFQNSPIGQDRAAQLIFGGVEATALLPITLSVDYQEGFGVQTAPASRLKFTVPMELGINAAAFDRIDSIMKNAIELGAFPGGQVVVAKDGKVIYQKAFGHQTYDNTEEVTNKTLYDLASVTKIASSTASLMYLQGQKQFSLDSTLGSYISDLTKGTVYNNVKLKDAMTHQAGFTPWLPFYTKTLVNKRPDTNLYSSQPEGERTAVVANNLYLNKHYEDTMLRTILLKPLNARTYKYSDIGYYFVKRIVEKTTHQTMNDFVENTFYAPMGLTTMGYLPLERYDLHQIAPTEEDKYYRYQTVRGYVHDMGAAMTNGVGGHAGLFSNAADLAGYMQMLLNGGTYGGKRYIPKAVVDEYTACQYCPRNRRGAGFDKPVVSGTGGPTTEAASKKSFGHTGFTGTMAWADPEYNINYVFLSNRTYPDAENWKITRMNIRTEIQKVIYEVLK